MKDIFKKYSNQHVGHGGMKCPCCKPPCKKKLRRSVRRKLKMEINR